MTRVPSGIHTRLSLLIQLDDDNVAAWEDYHEFLNINFISTPGKTFVVGGRDRATGYFYFLAMTPELHKRELSLRGDIVSVSHLDEPPRVLVSSNPEYPDDLRSDGMEGRVLLKLFIDTDGNVYETEVLKSNHLAFESAAVAAAADLRYAPPMRDGKPVRTSLVLSVDFSQ